MSKKTASAILPGAITVFAALTLIATLKPARAYAAGCYDSDAGELCDYVGGQWNGVCAGESEGFCACEVFPGGVPYFNDPNCVYYEAD